MISRFFIPAIIWGTIILILTLTPGQFLPKVDYWSVNSLDKYIHFLIFFIEQIFLLWGSFKKNHSISNKTIILLLFIGILFGLIIELIQTFIPHRSYDLNDLVANSIGCFLGIFVFFIYIRLNREKLHKFKY